MLENMIDLINQVKTERNITMLTVMGLTLFVSTCQATARDCWSRTKGAVIRRGQEEEGRNNHL